MPAPILAPLTHDADAALVPLGATGLDITKRSLVWKPGELVDEGKVRFLGLSNFTLGDLQTCGSVEVPGRRPCRQNPGA